MNGGQIGNVDLVKQLNSAAVYRLIDQQGPISRIQVADVSQLAPASVTKITRQLLERGLIKEVAQQASTGGRRAISLTTEVEPFHSIAVRLGRDYIQLSLHDLGGRELAFVQEDLNYSDQSDLMEGLLTTLKSFVAEQQYQIDQLIAIGITLPGLVNPTTGVVEYMPNTDIDNLALSDIIRDTFHVACFVGNDVRGMALAEHYFGASQDSQDSILVSVHRGTGAGIIVNGQVFLGHNRNVGEIGHIQIDPLGEQCQCGNFGCLETVAANPAIVERVQKLIKQGIQSTMKPPRNKKHKVTVAIVDDATALTPEPLTNLIVSPEFIASVVDESSPINILLLVTNAVFTASTKSVALPTFKLLISPTSVAKLLNVVLNVFTVSVVATLLSAIFTY